MMNFKEDVTRYVMDADDTKILELGQLGLAKTLRYVQMHIWGDDQLPTRWYAIEMLHKLAECYGAEHDEAFRNLIRRSLWAMNDESGNVPWAAPEVMAAIIKGQPQQYGEFIPLMMTNSIENPMCHQGLLWAIGYLGAAHYDALAQFLPPLRPFIESDEATMRGYAAWAFGEVGDRTMLEKIAILADDPAELMFYRHFKLVKMTVGDIAKNYA